MGTYRSWLGPLVGLLGLGVSGCAGPSVRYADVQLDITGSGLLDTDRVRICVDGFRVNEEALGSGTLSMTGLPAGTALSVTADHIVDDERSGRAGPVLLGDDSSHITEPWQSCTEDCSACTIEDEDNDSSMDADRLLIIRFLD